MSKRSSEVQRVAANNTPEKRNLTPEEALELQEIVRAVSLKKFEAAQVKGNTALIPRGQEVAAELEAIARLLDNSRNGWVSQKLMECGYPPGTQCSINLTTGEIYEAGNDTKA